MLLDMTRTHVPVLAGELIDILTSPGRDRGGLHVRRRRSRAARGGAVGPAGTLVCIDRDPAAEERFEELALEVPCDTRFLRMDFADGLAAARRRGRAGGPRLPRPRHLLHAGGRPERGFSYSYDAPLDMRMDPDQDVDAREIVNGWDERRLAQLFRRYGEEPSARADRARDRPPARARPDRDDGRAGGRRGGGAARRRSAQLRGRASGQARVPGDPDRGERRARVARPGAAARVGAPARRRPARGDLLPLARGPARQALPRRSRARLRCPPDFPVCVCGREPEAELLTRRAVVPSAGEVADNPRSRSGKLRAARKLAAGEAA